MRATLADPALARQAGRFVWLELDFDKPVNQPFISRREVGYTPTLLVVDPADERATASHIGGLTLPELNRFLDEGESAFRQRARSPADAALARGDEWLARGRYGDAAAACREALGLAAPGWRERTHAVGTLTWALMLNQEAQACAETAAVEAPDMPRGPQFARVVLAGFSCASGGRGAPWAESAQKILEPLAEEAVALPSALRDHRFQIYQRLIMAAQTQGDSAAAARWGHRWLDELDATKPADDDERSALDIARVDAASAIDEPDRVIPALIASERAMPGNYNASLRLAQMEEQAKRYDEALAACERGLVHVTGPVGRTWLLTTRGNALYDKGEMAGARAAFEQALQSAQTIGNKSNRENNIRKIRQALASLDKPGS